MNQEWLEIKNNLYVTTKMVPAGTTLLTQAPLVSVPTRSEQLGRCNYCLQKAYLQCCSKCHAAYFCSHTCFVKAWVHFHGKLCHKSSEDNLLERTLFTLHKEHPDTSSITPDMSVSAFQSLQVYPDESNYTQLETIRAKHGLTHCSTKELAQLTQRVHIASFTIMDHTRQLEPIGVGVYPVTSQYVRHSCRPNACLIYHKNVQAIVSLEDIPADTPISISYIDLVASKSERAKALQERFGSHFKCHCARCEGDFQVLDRMLDRSEQEASHYTQQELEHMLVKQIEPWSILEMIREYGADDTEASNNLVWLDAPHLTHFINRMIAPDIYSPVFQTKTQPQSTAAFYFDRLSPLLQGKLDQEEDRRRILPAIQALEHHKSLWLSVKAIQAAEQVLSNCITEGNWIHACRCAVFLNMVYRLFYPSLYPNMAYHSVLVARTSWNSLVQLELAGLGKKLERIYEAGVQLWVNVAEKSVARTFGKQSLFYREVIEIQWLFERDQKLK
ncbi:hypothetical protein BD560DRAFT_370878 [Blakeslea trispora]|nr:hypothetical protein BD560DRAFT_370878 [Blakeslea trispora]